MKTSICNIMLLVSGLSMILSCEMNSNETLETPISSKKVLVIIKDQSGSIQERSSDKEGQRKWMKRYLHDHYEPETDLVLLYINSSSNSSINQTCFNWKYSDEKLVEEYRSETDQLLDESTKENNNRIQEKKLQSLLLKKLFDEPSAAASNQTQILALLPQLDRLTKSYQTVSILMISDMIEESSFRNFSSNPPKTKQHAESMAFKDAEKIRTSFQLKTNPLSKTQSISVLVPARINPESLTVVPYYFEQLFAEFGYKSTISWSSL